MASGRIFLSYRRDDTRGVAGRLFDRLAKRFGKANVFIDVVAIEPGRDFTFPALGSPRARTTHALRWCSCWSTAPIRAPSSRCAPTPEHSPKSSSPDWRADFAWAEERTGEVSAAPSWRTWKVRSGRAA